MDVEYRTICPYCKDVVEDRNAIECPACETAHHYECWESNGGLCSVFGCKSRGEDNLLGCPWCNEVYIYGGRNTCLNCNSALMTSSEYFNFVQGHDWVRIQPVEGLNPLLAQGYLRNYGIVARIEKRPPVSMLLSRPPLLLISTEDEEAGRELLKELSESYVPCKTCGHILGVTETGCSYCSETGVEK